MPAGDRYASLIEFPLEQRRLEQRTLVGLLPARLLRDVRAVFRSSVIVDGADTDKELMERLIRARAEELRNDQQDWIGLCVSAAQARELQHLLKTQTDEMPIGNLSEHVARAADYGSEFQTLADRMAAFDAAPWPSEVWQLASYLVWADSLSVEAYPAS
jgi:hypothetical protein